MTMAAYVVRYPLSNQITVFWGICLSLFLSSSNPPAKGKKATASRSLGRTKKQGGGSPKKRKSSTADPDAISRVICQKRNVGPTSHQRSAGWNKARGARWIKIDYPRPDPTFCFFLSILLLTNYAVVTFRSSFF